MMRPKKKGDVGRWNSFYEIVFTSVDTFPSSMLPCLSPVSAWQIAHVCMHVHMCVFSSLFSQDMDQISKPKMEKLFEALLIHLSLLISHFEEGKVHDLHIVTICSKKSVNI